MTETAVLNLFCVECLQILNGDAHQKDYLDNSLCRLCVENYYAACAECSRMIAVDEAAVIGSGDEAVYRCPECKSTAAPNQPELNYAAEEIAELVDEYVALHREEKRIKDEMEVVKQKLKEIAEAESSGGKKPVTLAGANSSGVKCTYRTNLKADAEKVADLRDRLGEEMFAALFSEKTSFDVNKSNFEKVISADADLPEDVRRQIEAAVKVSVSATLNVA
jgi:hypothetical protein